MTKRLSYRKTLTVALLVSVASVACLAVGGKRAAASRGDVYTVIPPPIGATVTVLPNGAVDRTIGGVTYFTAGGAWYQPMYSGGNVTYRVIPQPGLIGWR